MPTYTRIAIIKHKEGCDVVTDKSHPVFNEYSANFFYFEQGILSKELSDDEHIITILLPNRQIKAVSKDGRVFTYDK